MSDQMKNGVPPIPTQGSSPVPNIPQPPALQQQPQPGQQAWQPQAVSQQQVPQQPKQQVPQAAQQSWQAQEVPQPQQAARAAGLAVAPGPHMLHKAVIILWTIRMGIGFIIAALCVAIGPILDAGTKLTLGGQPLSLGLIVTLAIVLVLLIIAICWFISFLSYKNFTWEITDTEFTLRRGIISKKQVHIPFRRIHSIDTNAGIIDRLLGLVTLNIQTAGSSKPEATMAGITLAEAEAMRVEIFARKRMVMNPAAASAAQGATVRGAAALRGTAEQALTGAANNLSSTIDQAGASLGQIAHGASVIDELDAVSSSMRGAFGGESYYEDAPVDFERKLNTKELIFAALSGKSTSAIVLAIFGALCSIAGYVGISERTLSLAQGAFVRMGALGIAAIAAMVIGIILLIWVFATLSAVVQYGGFTVRRRAGRLEIERGLLQRRFNGVAIDRIQSVAVKRGLVRRMIGYAEVVVSTVSNVSSSDSSKANSTDLTHGVMLHPFIKKDEVDDFIQAALPEFATVPHELTPLPKVALRRSCVRTIVWPGLVFAACAAAFNIFCIGPIEQASNLEIATWLAPLVAFILLIPAVPHAILWYRHAGYAHDKTMLVLQKGAYGIDLDYIPRRKIQWMQAAQNPFQYRAGVETIRATTAAGDSGTRNTLKDVAQPDSEALLDWVRPDRADEAGRGGLLS